MSIVKNIDMTCEFQHINMKFSSLQYVKLDKSWNYKNIMSPFSRVYIPLSGEGAAIAGGKKTLLQPGKIYIIPSMLKVSFECAEYLEKFYIHINAYKQDGLDALSDIGEVLILDECGEAEQLLLEKDNSTLESEIKTNAIILGILAKAIDEYDISLGEAEKYSYVTKLAIKYIGQHLTANLSISEISSAIFVNRVTLQKCFKDDVKISIGQYIDERVMIAAERELLKNERSIEKISEELGFCDRFYFTRKFTERYGMSPRKYMRANGITPKTREISKN